MTILIVGLGVQGTKRKNLIKNKKILTVDPKNKAANYKHIKHVPINSYDFVFLCVPDKEKYSLIKYCIQNKNERGLPITPIPPNQTSIAGGFFICHKDKINWWAETYDAKLSAYFKNNYLVKDDQIIIVDCVLSNLNDFLLFRENNPMYDNWFMFQRIYL
jgi:hypothetical protein